MCRRGQRVEAAPRYSSGRVWASCVSTSNRSQGFPPWFLLADYASSSRGPGEVLQRLSEIQGEESFTSINTKDDTNRMSVCGVGSGYGWSVQDGPRWHDTSSSGRR